MTDTRTVEEMMRAKAMDRAREIDAAMFGMTSTASPGPGLTMDKLWSVASMFTGPKIQVSRFHPKHPTRKYRVIYHAHPLVTRLCWVLRHWVRIRPWVEAWYPDDQDPYYLRDFNTMVVGERHYRILEGELL